MKIIAISEDDLAKVSALVIAKDFKGAPDVVIETALIAVSKLGALLFDGVSDNDKVTMVKAKW